MKMKILRPCAIPVVSAISLITSIHAKPEAPVVAPAVKTNIILCMTDDQGWGDVSYNGLKVIKTPHLDAMAAAGLRFNRFYSAHSNCSPTRASVMTGRHPNRSGVFSPGMPLRQQEMTLAQAVKTVGYRTGHFGKWHLSGGKSGMGRALPASDPLHPGHFGFDEWFSVSNFFETDWTFSRNGEPVQVAGDGSDAIVAEALKFIAKNASQDAAFLACIWFGSPHVPLKPTAEDLKAAGGLPYYGEILGIDRSMGALRAGLRKLGIADNTMLWFNSDNGAWRQPKATTDINGSNGVLRGGKNQLWEGGIRVPGLIEWPAQIKQPTITNVPVVTSDIYPTVIDLLQIKLPHQTLPLDGITLMPLIEGKIKERPQPIGFWMHAGTAVWSDNRYKLHKMPDNKYELYDISSDISEKSEISADHPEIVARMKGELETWQQSVTRSNRGEDYPEKKVIENAIPKAQ